MAFVLVMGVKVCELYDVSLGLFLALHIVI